MEQIRAFIAIELPDELKVKLRQLGAGLPARQATWLKWVDPDSIHLTLKFLGNIPADRTDEILLAMEKATREVPSFQLEVKDLGVFPNPKRVQVAWVGISGEIDKLGPLQQRLESNLALLGFAPETRPFTPHLTLARVRNQASPEEQRKFGELITGTRFEAGIIKVTAISLMRSQLTRAGAIYSRIGLAKLS